MCLQTVGRVYKRPVRKVRFGYKLFHLDNGILRFEYRGLNGTNVVTRHKWLLANGGALLSTTATPQNYPCGFHVFATRKAANTWRGGERSMRVVRVRVRGILAWGTQLNRNLKTFVAQEIFVP